MHTAGVEKAEHNWPQQLYRVLRDNQVLQMSYVPDAGHTALINLFCDDPEVDANVLTTEEEGVAIGVGAWLGGVRSVLLMQSSCLLYTSPSPRDQRGSRMPSSA